MIAGQVIIYINLHESYHEGEKATFEEKIDVSPGHVLVTSLSRSVHSALQPLVKNEVR